MSIALLLGFLFAISILPVVGTAAPRGPSFDCAKAASPVEHAICGDPRLGAADLALSQYYTAALVAAGAFHDDLLAFERAWLKRRGPECGVTSSNPVQQPDMPDRITCLLHLIKDRAETLKPPAYGYMSTQFYDLRSQPPLALWLLNEAFAEMPFAPQAAEHVFTNIRGAPADLGHLMVARLFDPPSDANTTLQQMLSRKLLQADQDEQKLAEAYDGSISDLVPFMLSASATLVLPCRLFEEFPDLILATGAAYGGGRDNFVPRAACSDYEYPYPEGAAMLAKTAEPYDGGAFGRCTGTIRFAEFATNRMYELISRVAPAVLLQLGGHHRQHSHASGITLPSVPENIPLESWSYISVWNRHEFLSFKTVYYKAVSQFRSMYEERWGFSPIDAAHAAHVALWLPLLWTSEAAPAKPIAIAIMASDPSHALQPFLTRKLPEHETSEPLLSLSIDNLDALKALLAAHADVDATNDFGKTPLMTAAQFDKGEAISLLIKAGAKINAQSRAPKDIPDNDTQAGDRRGGGCSANHILHGQRTAIMYAASNGSLTNIRQLLANGADKTRTDSYGLTAFDYLIGKGPVPPNPRMSNADRAEAMRLLKVH